MTPAPFGGRVALTVLLPFIAIRIALFGVLWWVVTDGSAYNWWFGLMLVLAASASSLALMPPLRLRAKALVPFLTYFIHHSVLGGVDVARRALHPDLPIDPGFIETPLRVKSDMARFAVATTMSLLPGTVSVEMRESTLRLHVLDRSLPVVEALADLERRVAALAGETLDGDE
jgi:multicomponent Na+:H+ antiporter subunit E